MVGPVIACLTIASPPTDSSFYAYLSSAHAPGFRTWRQGRQEAGLIRAYTQLCVAPIQMVSILVMGLWYYHYRGGPSVCTSDAGLVCLDVRAESLSVMCSEETSEGADGKKCYGVLWIGCGCCIEEGETWEPG
jgi:hypothetical protein